ncbi:MAG: FlgD immunoglobulin-like domain containing protein [Candidatus Edwardsbacteria bacterium]|nr:FlgD immunoglobulin-like domain containing protein [Candidatus Edwardsbacteria bacterium]
MIDGREIEIPGYSYDASTGKLEFLPSDLDPLDWGQHIVTLDVRDKAGNPASQAYSLFNVLIDTAGPSLLAVRPEDGKLINTGYPYLGFFGTDDGPLAGLSFKAFLDRPDTGAGDPLTVRRDTLFTAYGAVPGYSAQVSLSAPLAAGSHLLKLVATDSAGNAATVFRSFTVCFDTTPPVVLDLWPRDGSISATARPRLKARFAESGSGATGATGLEYARLSFDGQVKQERRDLPADSIFELSYIPETELLNSSEHLVAISLKDKAGQSRNLSASFTVLLDNVPPQLLSFAPDQGAIVSAGMPLIQAEFYENAGGSGFDTAGIKLSVDGNPCERQITLRNNTALISFTPQTSLGDGAHCALVSVADKVGNAAEWQWSFTVYTGAADTSAPAITVIRPGANAYVNPARPQYLFSAAVRDTVSGVLPESLKISLNSQVLNHNYQPASGLLTAGPVNLIPGQGYQLGIKTFDRAFNKNEQWRHFSCLADSQGPRLEWRSDSVLFGSSPSAEFTPNGSEGLGPGPALKAEAIDDGAGVVPDSLSASIDGQPAPVTYAQTGSAFLVTITPDSFLAPGGHAAFLRAVDDAGNVSAASFVFRTRADSIPPVVRDIRPALPVVYDPRPVFSCMVSDSGSALGSVWLMLDGQAYDCALDSNDGRYFRQLPDPFIIGSQHIFCFTAFDLAGNKTVSPKFVFAAGQDTVAPAIAQVCPAGTVYDLRPQISALVFDEANGSGLDIASIGLLIDSQPALPQINFLDWGGVELRYQPNSALSAGQRWIDVSGSDQAGNPNHYRSSFTIASGAIDTTGPEIALDRPAEDGTAYVGAFGSLITFMGNVRDTGSGVDAPGLTFKLNGNPLSGDLQYDPLGGGFTFAATSPLPLSDTEREDNSPQSLLQVTAADRAGNVRSLDRVFEIAVDSIAPMAIDFWPQDGARITDQQPLVWVKTKDDQSGLDSDSLTISIDGLPIAARLENAGPYVKLAGRPDWILAPVMSHQAGFRLKDAAGNIRTVISNFTTSQDSIPPVIAALSPADNSVCYQAAPAAAAALSDLGCGIDPDSIRLLLDDQVINCTGAFDPNTGRFSKTLPPLADSSRHSLCLSVKDLSGNRTTAVSSFFVVIDTIAPAIASFLPVSDTLENGRPFIEAQVTDNAALRALTLSIDGQPVVPDQFLLTPLHGMLSYRPAGALSLGQHLLSLVAHDKAGHEAAQERRIYVRSTAPDSTPPQVSIEKPTGDHFIRQPGDSFLIASRAIDTISGIRPDSLYLSLDNRPLAFTYNAVSGILWSKTVSAAGNHVISVSAYDRSGNRAVAGASFDLRLDQEPPACIPIAVPGGILQQPQFEFRTALADTLSGVDTATIAVLLDGAAVNRTLRLDALNRWEASAVNNSPFGDGTAHQYQVTAADKAGNLGQSEICRFTVNLDNIPPVIYALNPADSATGATVYVKRPQVSCRLADAGATGATGATGSGIDPDSIALFLDNQPAVAGSAYSYQPDSGILSAQWPVDLDAETQHSWAVNICDRAGNRAQSYNRFTVRLDTVVPTSKFVNPSSGAVVNTSRPVITVELADNASGSGIAASSIALSIDGAPVPANFDRIKGTVSYQPLNGLGNGAHRAALAAGDAAGNMTQAQCAFTIDAGSDLTPPFLAAVRPTDGAILYAGNNGADVLAVIGDAETGIDTARLALTVDGQAVPLAGYDQLTGKARWRVTGAAANAQHRLGITAFDRAGNHVAHQSVFTLQADLAPPELGQAAVSQQNGILLAVPAWDAASGVDPASIRCLVDGAPAPSEYRSDRIVISPAGSWSQGSLHALSVSVSDLAGNANAREYDIRYADQAGPALLSLEPCSGDTVFAPRGFTIACRLTDQGSGRGETRLWLDDKALSLQISGSGNSWLVMATAPPSMSEGRHRITVLACDGSGNVSDYLSSFLYRPDSAAPVVVLIEPVSTDTVYTGAMTVRARIADDRSGILSDGVTVTVDDMFYRIELDQDAGATGQWALTARPDQGSVLEDGRHLAHLEVRDRAGNQAMPMELPFYSVLDRIAPAFGEIYPPAGSYVDSLPEISALISDFQSGVDTSSVAVVIGQTPITVAVTMLEDQCWRLKASPGQALPPGQHQFTIRASDKAGVRNSYNGAFFISNALALANLKLYPNPFNQQLRIDYVLTRAARAARVKVYAVTGQLVKELKGQAKAGLNSIAWDGRNNSGASVSSGVYIYRLEVTPKEQNQSLISRLGKIVRIR